MNDTKMSDTLDLELCLGFGPRSVEEKSNGAAAKGVRVDLLLCTGAKKDAACGGTRQRAEEAVVAVGDHDETEQPTSAEGEGEEEAAAEPGTKKRAKTETPAAAVASTPAPRRAQRKKQANNNLNPPAAHQGDGGATEPAWVRAELLTRHALPADLPLHFVQDKVLTKSDLKSDQSRILIWSSGAERLRPLLSAGELSQCGLDATRRRRTKPTQGPDGGEKKRDDKTRYPGVPVLVYERGGAERAASELRLNSFSSTKAMVINGQGYGRFAAASGFKQGDLVEVWAFRRPHDEHLCFVIAKRDEHRRTSILDERSGGRTTSICALSSIQNLDVPATVAALVCVWRAVDAFLGPTLEAHTSVQHVEELLAALLRGPVVPVSVTGLTGAGVNRR